MSILQTIGLKKYYGTEPDITRAIDGVNFTVEQGEFNQTIVMITHNNEIARIVRIEDGKMAG